MYNRDDGSGRQRWRINRIGGLLGELLLKYNIQNAGGRDGCNQYLSTTSSCNSNLVDMYDRDDGSGRQRWEIQPVPNKPNTYTIRIAGGRAGLFSSLLCNNYLSTASCGSNLVDLYSNDDGSGRQQWIFTKVG